MEEIFSQQNHHLSYNVQERPDLTIGITTRTDGHSPYPNNAFNMARYIDDNPENITKHQRILADEIGFSCDSWVFPIQTHENKIQEVKSSDRGKNISELTNELYGLDGLYTYESNILLTMCFADCVPIYLYDTNSEYVGLCHAGWRGTQSQIIK